MSHTPVEAVEVLLWGRTLGAVATNPQTGHYAFKYAPAWVASGIEVAPLHMPLSDKTYEFPGLNPDTYMGLPPLLSDALPDAFGNALVNAWMAENGISVEEITPLDRLAYAADRAMGALEFRPPAGPPTHITPTAIALVDLVTAARQTVEGKLSTGEAAHAALQQLIQVGTSAGGARPKAIVAYNPETGDVRTAHGEQPDGFEQWMIKLDGVTATGMDGHGDGLGDSAPYGRIEYAYYLMAGAAGINMSLCQLLTEGPRRHFMTRRFDRGPGGRRHHVISLCGLAHLDFNLRKTHSYDQYLATVRALGLSSDDLEQAYRRVVFNVCGVNRDDHTKNFSFLREETGPWELAPAFDVTHSYRPDSLWTARHLMAVSGKFEDITVKDLHGLGDRHDVPGYRQIVRDIIDVTSAWPTFAEAAEVDDTATAAVLDDIEAFRPT